MLRHFLFCKIQRNQKSSVQWRACQSEAPGFMTLKLYGRHRKECNGGHPDDAQ
jgi:hypothetical protein